MEKITIVKENDVEYRMVDLTENGLWLLYRAMVCNMIVKSNVENMFDCDVWQFTESLDMSFDETRKLPLSQWDSQIKKELMEYLEDCRSH